jgi:aspartokinase
VGELTPKSKDYVVSFGERFLHHRWGAIKDCHFETQCFTGKEAGIVTDSNLATQTPS